jgi:hypothetical protein
MMLPVGIFVLLPFVQIVTGNVNFQKAGPVLILGIITIRLVFIFNTHQVYTNRLNWYQGKFDEMDRLHTQRLMLKDKDIPIDTLVMTWASGYESLILSSVNGPQYTKSIVIDNDLKPYEPYLKTDTLTLAKWGVWGAKDLPKNYFLMRRGYYIMQ